MPDVIVNIRYDTEASSSTNADAHLSAIRNQLRNMYMGNIYAHGLPLNKVKYQTKTIRLESGDFIVPNIQSTIVVKLGGAFQEIGGDNENAGGGYQKLG